MEIKRIYIATNNIVETARRELSNTTSALQYFVITSLEKLFDPSNLSLTIKPIKPYIEDPEIKRQKRPKSPQKKTKRFCKKGNKIGFYIGDHFIPFSSIDDTESELA